ncbi:hypothetical protein FOZ62_018244, partial [Perkinsus olseni]
LWAGSMERIVRDPVTKKVAKEKIPLDLRWVEGQRSSKPVVPSAEDLGRNGNLRLPEWNKCDYKESTAGSARLVEDLSVTEWIRLCLTGITFFATSCSMTLQGIFSIPFAIKMGLS